LTLELGLKAACKILFYPVSSFLSGEVLALVNGILELFLQVLDNECWPLGFHKVERLGMITEFNRINPDKVHVGFVLGCNGFYSSDVGILVLLRYVEEQVGKRLGAGGVNSVIVAIDLVKDGNGQFCNPIFEVFFGERRNWVGVFRLGFIERTVNDNGGRRDSGGFNSILVCCDTKKIIVTVSVRGRNEFGGRRIC